MLEFLQLYAVKGFMSVLPVALETKPLIVPHTYFHFHLHELYKQQKSAFLQVVCVCDSISDLTSGLCFRVDI